MTYLELLLSPGQGTTRPGLGCEFQGFSLSGRTSLSSGASRGLPRDLTPGGNLSREGTKLGSGSRRLREVTAVSEYVNSLPVTGGVVHSLLMQKTRFGPISGTY